MALQWISLGEHLEWKPVFEALDRWQIPPCSDLPGVGSPCQAGAGQRRFRERRPAGKTKHVREWPQYMVCVWIGHSRVIAREHNFQVTDEHFRQAAQNPAHEAKKKLRTPSHLTAYK